MLPGAAYTSDEVLAWERRHLFAGSWMCLGRTGGAGATGATQRAVTVGRSRRAADLPARRPVRAFANVCRHRAHEFVDPGDGPRPAGLVCPYHGWSYELTGALKAAPRMGPDLARGELGLVELPAVDWHGWTFVNATGDRRARSTSTSARSTSWSRRTSRRSWWSRPGTATRWRRTGS